MSYIFYRSSSITPMFSVKSTSNSTSGKGCNRTNDYLVAILESSRYHAVGRASEDAKISRLVILQLYEHFFNLQVNRVLLNDSSFFLEALASYNENGITPTDDGIPVELLDPSNLPGMLIYKISDELENGR